MNYLKALTNRKVIRDTLEYQVVVDDDLKSKFTMRFPTRKHARTYKKLIEATKKPCSVRIMREESTPEGFIVNKREIY